MNISKHITLQEATNTSTGIENIPPPEVISKMVEVAIACFEPLREWYGKPIRINSFYRNTLVNEKVGGSATSQHCKGEAIDMSGGNKVENKKIFDWCKANLIFDQIINEYDYKWIHISFRKGNNRNQTIIKT